MKPEHKQYEILVAESNMGDFILIEEYIEDEFRSYNLTHAESTEKILEYFDSTPVHPDVVLLDITMNGKNYSEWVERIINLAEPAPVLLLTGYTHIPICVSMLQVGASDYLLKDELTENILEKSIVFNIERKSFVNRIRESQQRYSDLFHLSPQPMWVLDYETLRFLDVNEATLHNYGYTRSEFLSMTIRDLRSGESQTDTDEELRGDFDHTLGEMLFHTKHQRKNGDIIYVEVRSSQLMVNNKEARLVLATDVTERQAYIGAIEKQNQKLRDIAWVQSHVVRAPLARLLGVVQMVQEEEDAPEHIQKLLKIMTESAKELDSVIHDVAKKAELINMD